MAGEKLTAKERWLARAERYEDWASKADAKASAIDASMPSYARDPAFMTQPARSNHAVSRERQRLAGRERRAHELREKAAAYRSKATSLRSMSSRNAGDAERAREVVREAITEAVHEGSYVDCVYGVRRVLKVNAKTLRLQGALGPLTIDKALCSVIPQRCGTCGAWRKPTPPETAGECWSADRLDGDTSKGPAGYHFATRTCEAWFPAALSQGGRGDG